MNPVIELLRKKNPRREGTHGWRSWQLIKKGMTYDEYIAAGGRRGDLSWDIEREHARVTINGKVVELPAAAPRGFTKGNAPHRTAEAVAMDDSKVKTVRSSKRWTDRIVWEAINVRVKTADGAVTFPWREKKLHVFISPKGNEYVKAKPTEKADLLVRLDGTNWIVRLRKLEGSAALKKHKRERKEVEHGKKAHAERKKAKAKKTKHLKRLASK